MKIIGLLDNDFIMPPFEKEGAYCLHLSVGWSVCRPYVVHSISFDPFAWF